MITVTLLPNKYNAYYNTRIIMDDEIIFMTDTKIQNKTINKQYVEIYGDYGFKKEKQILHDGEYLLELKYSKFFEFSLKIILYYTAFFFVYLLLFISLYLSSGSVNSYLHIPFISTPFFLVYAFIFPLLSFPKLVICKVG